MYQKRHSRKYFVLMLTLGLMMFSVNLISVFAVPVVTDFDGFTVGDIHGQGGWAHPGGNPSGTHHDHYVVANNADALTNYPQFGTHSLRISNAIATSNFGHHTSSVAVSQTAGESTSGNGTAQVPYYEAQWDFASFTPGVHQPDMRVTASPNPHSSNGRMYWIAMFDRPTGLEIQVGDHSTGGGFAYTTIASDLSNTSAHTVRITVAFQENAVPQGTGHDGINNDIVCVWVNGTLRHQGTTWENYFRATVAEHGAYGGYPPAVNSILFQTTGTTPYPANLNKGFLFDNFSADSGAIPAGLESGCIPTSVATPTPPATGSTTTSSPALAPCALVGGSTSSVVRADAAAAGVYCRIINENGTYVQSAAEVGDINLINRGVRQAVDIFRFDNNGVQLTSLGSPTWVCLQGAGEFFFRDANAQPRTTALLPSTQQNGFTCATIPNAGTVVLAG